EEAVDLRGPLAVADHRGRTAEPRELRQPVMTARPGADAARRQRIELRARPRDITPLGEHEREPAAKRPRRGPRPGPGLQQRHGLVEAALLPEELRALGEEAVDR